MGLSDHREKKRGMPSTLEECTALHAILAAIADWFRGALATLSVETQFAQPEDELIVRLELAERDLANVHSLALDVVRDIESVSDQENALLRDSFRDVVVFAADAIEAVQAYRWAIMERNADADIVAGRVEEFDSVDRLLARLKQH